MRRLKYFVNATNYYQKTGNEIKVIKTKSCGYLNKRKTGILKQFFGGVDGWVSYDVTPTSQNNI